MATTITTATTATTSTPTLMTTSALGSTPSALSDTTTSNIQTMSTSSVMSGCGTPGNVTYATRLGDVFSFGSTVNYTCDNNSTLTSSFLCGQDGVWNGTQLNCPPPTVTTVSCGDPGNVDGASRVGNSFFAGSSVNYTCNNDNSLTFSLYCEPTSNWNGTLISCPTSTSTLWIVSLAVTFTLAGLLCVILLITLFVDFGRYRHRKSKATAARIRKVEQSRNVREHGRPALFYVPISHKTQMMIYNDYAPKKVDLLPYDEAKKFFPKNSHLPPINFDSDGNEKKKKKKKSRLLKGRRVSDENMMEMGMNSTPLDIRNNRVAPMGGNDSFHQSPDGGIENSPYGAESWDNDAYYKSHQEANQMLSDSSHSAAPKFKKKKKKKVYQELDDHESGSIDLRDAQSLQPAAPPIDSTPNDLNQGTGPPDYNYPV